MTTQHPVQAGTRNAGHSVTDASRCHTSALARHTRTTSETLTSLPPNDRPLNVSVQGIATHQRWGQQGKKEKKKRKHGSHTPVHGYVPITREASAAISSCTNARRPCDCTCATGAVAKKSTTCAWVSRRQQGTATTTTRVRDTRTHQFRAQDP